MRFCCPCLTKEHLNFLMDVNNPRPENSFRHSLFIPDIVMPHPSNKCSICFEAQPISPDWLCFFKENHVFVLSVISPLSWPKHTLGHSVRCRTPTIDTASWILVFMTHKANGSFSILLDSFTWNMNFDSALFAQLKMLNHGTANEWNSYIHWKLDFIVCREETVQTLPRSSYLLNTGL